MKLFVLNKEDFDNDFPATQKEVHRIAYNYLLKELAQKGLHPLNFKIDYDLWVVEFNFVNKIENVYFYSYERW